MAGLKRQVLALMNDDAPPPERLAGYVVRERAVFEVRPA
jgi:hypothetical protein